MHWVAAANSNGVRGVHFSVKVYLRCTFDTYRLINVYCLSQVVMSKCTKNYKTSPWHAHACVHGSGKGFPGCRGVLGTPNDAPFAVIVASQCPGRARASAISAPKFEGVMHSFTKFTK